MRDKNIDLLRFIGLTLIILAHVSPPYILFNVRCFDVPLMVFISGLTCYQKNIKFSYSFIQHRFSRLVIPVWIFLTVYFIVLLLLQAKGIDLGLTKQDIWGSYILLGGIGYVWVIRVFLLVGFISPFVLKLNNLIKNNIIFILIYTILILCYLVITFLHIGINNSIIKYIVLYAIGYAFLFLLGVRIKDFTKKDITILISIMLVVFGFMAYIDITTATIITPTILHINDFKYPPTNIFLIYGIIMSVIIYFIVYSKKRTQLNSFVNFVGCNSIWIYLWHIPFITITSYIDIN